LNNDSIDNLSIDSNARLFVGRRRLDLMNEYLDKMNQNPEEVGKTTNAGWRKIVDEGRIVLQIAGNISQMATQEGDLVAPWKQCFAGVQKSRVFEYEPIPNAKNRPNFKIDILIEDF